MTDTPSDLDILMTRVAEINAKPAGSFTPADIRVIVGYHRYARSQRAAGVKTAKLEKPKVNVEALLGHITPPAAPSTIRRHR